MLMHGDPNDCFFSVKKAVCAFNIAIDVDQDDLSSVRLLKDVHMLVVISVAGLTGRWLNHLK